VIYGCPGSGKTYLCASILNFWHEKFGDDYGIAGGIYYVEENQLFSKIKDAYSSDQNEENIVHMLKTQKYLIFDDLGSDKTKEWNQSIFLDIIDSRLDPECATVITTNYFPKEIETWEPHGKRIFSRLFAKENTLVEHNMFDRREPMSQMAFPVIET